MVHTRQSQAFRPMHYQSRPPGLPIETFTLEKLVGRVGAAYLEANERLYFHAVVLCTGGRGRHHVDFAEVPLRPGRVLHLRPTQVHRWDFARPYEAQLVVLPDSPGLLAGPGWPVGASVVDLPDRSWKVALQTIGLIAEEQEKFTGSPGSGAMLEALRQLVVLQLQLGRTGEAAEARLPPTYLAFRDVIQAGPIKSHRVSDFAAQLGFSARTISRACYEARGMTAKQVLDEWIGLEARRLLATSDQKIGAIATTLGFDDAPNFTTFFRRVVGGTPMEFRRTHGKPDRP